MIESGVGICLWIIIEVSTTRKFGKSFQLRETKAIKRRILKVLIYFIPKNCRKGRYLVALESFELTGIAIVENFQDLMNFKSFNRKTDETMFQAVNLFLIDSLNDFNNYDALLLTCPNTYSFDSLLLKTLFSTLFHKF